MPTVLIAAATSLGQIKQRGEYQDAMVYADTDALRALEAITRHRPNLVVIESAFAVTSRGTALINRIKADPSLAQCEVRVVTHDMSPIVPVAPPAADVERGSTPPDMAFHQPPTPETPAPRLPAAPSMPPAPLVPATPPAVSLPLDSSGTRRAPRHDMAEGLEALVDGNPATLVDLSIEGAQLISPTTLKPNQRVRLTLPGLTTLRVSGEIAWAMFEMPQGRPRYRVGMAFVDPDAEGLQRFIEANSK